MPEIHYSAKVGQRVQQILTKLSEEIGVESGFVERKSKLGGAQFSQMMVLGCMKKAKMSLEELAQVSEELGTPVTDSGVDQRIDEEAVSMLQQILQKSLTALPGKKTLAVGMLARFGAVYLLDSTQLELPAHMAKCFPGSGGHASPAAVKLQVQYDYLRGTFHQIEVGAATNPDQNCRLQLGDPQTGSLHLFDLGYFKQQVLQQIADQANFFLTRLDARTALFTEEMQPVRLHLLLRQTSADRLEMHVRLGSLVQLPVRVLFQRLPGKVVEERRRKAIQRAQTKGRTPSEDYLALLEWNFFVTNVSEDWLSFDQILLLYHLRWQIELVFKLWKSQAGLDALGVWRKDRLLVQLYARLIGLTLFFALATPFRWFDQRELSLPKAFRSFQDAIPLMLSAIRHSWSAFSAVLDHLYARWIRFDAKTHRIKQPSTLHALFLAS
jgi:hypothetical protein